MRFQIETSVFKSLRRGVDREQKDNFSLSWRLPFPFLFFTLLIAYVTSHLEIKRKTSISSMLSDDVHRTKNKVLGPVVQTIDIATHGWITVQWISIEKTNGWLSIRRIAYSILRTTRTCYCFRDPISTAAVAKAKLFVLIYPMTIKSQSLKTEKNVHGIINNE